jgi:hypothetical protein
MRKGLFAEILTPIAESNGYLPSLEQLAGGALNCDGCCLSGFWWLRGELFPGIGTLAR